MAQPVATMLVCFFKFAREAVGASFVPGIPCALCLLGRACFLQHSGALAPRECGDAFRCLKSRICGTHYSPSAVGGGLPSHATSARPPAWYRAFVISKMK
jgi:hypothetical protein